MTIADLPQLSRADIESMTPEQRRMILRAALPRLPEPYIPHPPHAPQALFLLDHRKEAFYGGAAGGGKSDALLMSALQYVDVPRYSALLLRRSWPDLSQPGALLERAASWLADSPAKPHDGGRYWTFPSGARLSFGYVQYPRDVSQFKSAEFQMIGFDELTDHVESSYRFMFSRLRRPSISCANCRVAVEKIEPGQPSTTVHGLVGDEIAREDGWAHARGQGNYLLHCNDPQPNARALREYGPAPDGMTLFDVPLRVRSASNPGGVGHAWVRDRFIDAERRLKTASFYPARLADNPSLDKESYEDSLSHLAPVERQRLLDGDWDVTQEGLMFKREWFQVIELGAVPAGGRPVRYWDFAATKVKATGDRNDPDWTVGALLKELDGVFYLLDLVRIRDDPHAVETVIANTASQDGTGVRIRVEQEPGSSGKIAVDHYRRHILVGYDVGVTRPTTAKEERARLWASAAGAGNFKLVGGAWNRDFVDEVTAFPQSAHDDQTDAVSGAFEVLTKPQGRLLV